FFFFSSRRRHTRFSRDWSSDVCSSDLTVAQAQRRVEAAIEDRRRIGGGAIVHGQRLADLLADVQVDAVVRVHRRLDLEDDAGLRSEERRVGKERGSLWAMCECEN